MSRSRTIVGIAIVGIAIISAGVAVRAETKSPSSGAAASAAASGAPPAPAVATGANGQRVQLVPVRNMTTAAKSEVTGLLQPAKALQLGFEIGGRLSEILVKKGAPVSAGQIIAKLDPELADAQVAQAEAAVKAAEAQAAVAADAAKRSEELRSTNNISDQQAAANANQSLAAAAQVLAAKAQLAQMRVNRRRHDLRAPFTGVLVDAPDQVGASVTSQSLLFSLEQLDPLSMHTTAAEGDRPLLKMGSKVLVQSAGNAALSTEEATLASIIPSADAQTRRVPIEISVPNHQGRFTAHTLARAILTLGAQRPAQAVSASALASTGGDHLFVLGEGGSVRRVPINVLDRGPKEVIFESNDGAPLDQVIDFPGVDLRSGMKVSVR